SELQPCPHCGRSFRPAIVEKHVKVCQSVFAANSTDAKRQVFDSRRHRLKGTPLEGLASQTCGRSGTEAAVPHGANERRVSSTPPRMRPDRLVKSSTSTVRTAEKGIASGSPELLHRSVSDVLTPRTLQDMQERKSNLDIWEQEVQEAIQAMSEPASEDVGESVVDSQQANLPTSSPLNGSLRALEERATLLERARLGAKMGQKPRQALAGSMSETVLCHNSDVLCSQQSAFTRTSGSAKSTQPLLWKQASWAAGCPEALSRTQPAVPSMEAPLSSRSNRSMAEATDSNKRHRSTDILVPAAMDFDELDELDPIELPEQHKPQRFTGSLMAQHLDCMIAAGKTPPLTWAVAGNILAHCKSKPGLVHVTSKTPFLEMASRCKVLVSAAGPYTLHGEAVVDACIKASTHYIDVCGELPWMCAIVERYHAQAQRSGVSIVISAGNISVPDDVLCYSLVQEIGPLRCFREYFSQYGGISGGTLQSQVSNPEVDQMPFCLGGSREAGIRPDDLDCETVEVDPWFPSLYLAPAYNSFVASRVVRRSCQLFEERGQVNYGAQLSVVIREPQLQKAVAEQLLHQLQPRADESDRGAEKIQSARERGEAPWPGQGPPARTRQMYGSEILGVAQGESGEWAYARWTSGCAYEVSGMAAIAGAMVLANDAEPERPRAGVVTPAYAFHGSRWMNILVSASFANGSGRKISLEVFQGKPSEEDMDLSPAQNHSSQPTQAKPGLGREDPLPGRQSQTAGSFAVMNTALVQPPAGASRLSSTASGSQQTPRQRQAPVIPAAPPPSPASPKHAALDLEPSIAGTPRLVHSAAKGCAQSSLQHPVVYQQYTQVYRFAASKANAQASSTPIRERASVLVPKLDLRKVTVVRK
ncbi:unnamed protein product, partial [Symbiodinium pilosum]